MSGRGGVPENTGNVIAPLISALMEAGDTAGVEAELDRYFFPAAKPEKPLFDFESIDWSSELAPDNDPSEMERWNYRRPG